MAIVARSSTSQRVWRATWFLLIMAQMLAQQAKPTL